MSRASEVAPNGRKELNGKSYYGVALAATAVLVMFATGGLVAAETQPAKHLMALGLPDSSPAAPPSVTPAPPRPPAPTTTTTAFVLPRVVSITPSNGTHNVAVNDPITIKLSRPPADNAPMPELNPPVQGVWAVRGDMVKFTPSVAYAPWSVEKVSVPVGLVVTAQQSSFNIEGVGTPRAEQLLAELKYLPLRFGLSQLSSSLDLESSVASLVSPLPQPGIFTWRYPAIPTSLSAQWSPGQYNVILQGAIMTFEDQYNLNIDGLMGPDVWHALSAAVAARRVDSQPYDYLMVSEVLPEQLVVWRNGKDTYQTPANTGVEGANTPVGTWPVYLRFQTTTMMGTDVDGTKYDVPDVPWVAYFNGGDAVHGYWRYSYGYPQSNGCVELPVSNAQVVWAMDPLGTLVNVSD